MSVTTEQVLEVIGKANLVDDVKSLDLDKALSEQGIDSLDFSNVLFNMEEVFEIEIPDEDIDALLTVNNIVAYINEKI
ncbi:MAG: acyl carrier protein [Hydrogenovibrio sp.]